MSWSLYVERRLRKDGLHELQIPTNIYCNRGRLYIVMFLQQVKSGNWLRQRYLWRVETFKWTYEGRVANLDTFISNLHTLLLGAKRRYLVVSSVLPWLRGYQQEKENGSCKELHFLSLEMFPMHWSGMMWQAVGRERLYTFTYHQLFMCVIKTIL